MLSVRKLGHIDYSLGANRLISLPAAWCRNDILSAFIAKGWIVFSFAGIKLHRVICVQPSKIKPKQKEELVVLSQDKCHWFQCHNGVCAVCHSLGDLCTLGEQRMQSIL